MENKSLRIKIEINNKVKAPISLANIRKKVKAFLSKEGKSVQLKAPISIALVDKPTIRKLNRKYRKIDKITNVLSFGKLGEDLTEIVICWPRVKEEAIKAKISIKEYFNYVLIHGLENLIQ